MVIRNATGACRLCLTLLSVFHGSCATGLRRARAMSLGTVVGIDTQQLLRCRTRNKGAPEGAYAPRFRVGLAEIALST